MPSPTRSRRPSTPASAKEELYDIPFQDAIEELGEVPLASLDSFVIPSRDERGGTNHIHLNLPPYLLRQVLIICKSSRFPYLEMGDLIRHAIHRHLHWCTQIRKTLPPHINQTLEAMSEIARDYEFNSRSRQVLADIDNVVDKCIAEGASHEAVRLLAILKSRVDVAAISPRQAQARADIIRRYGNVLNATGADKGESN